jgi:hemolysin activation/secretion protein
MRWNDPFSIQVDAVVTQGNKRLPNEVLQKAVRVHVGKRISVQRLSAITRLVEKAYREAGFQAQAYVPEQSFASGTLVIQVIER